MRNAFLGLLARGPAHGYELRQAFESIFGGARPRINAGQVYTTLARLERDGLVTGERVRQEDRPDKVVYRLTQEGKRALGQWFSSPVEGEPFKSDFFLKLVMARVTGLADARSLIEQQRRAYLQDLRTLNEMAASGEGDGMAALLIEGAALRTEADLKWLDLCERRFADGV